MTTILGFRSSEPDPDHTTLHCPCGATFTWSGFDERLEPWTEKHLRHTKLCPECRTPVGEQHKPDCSIEQCALCGWPMIRCKCVKGAEYDAEVQQVGGFMPWTGLPPGHAEAAEYDLWCCFTLTATGHAFKPCKSTDMGAKPNLAAVVQLCRWDKEKRRWILQDTETLAKEVERQKQEEIAALRARLAELEGK